MYSTPLLGKASTILEDAALRGLRLTTAESCTGGLIAGLLTEVPGASVVFDTGLVAYSNDTKMTMLGVPRATIESAGAVSRETALAMATGALSLAGAQVSVAVTGVAGPSGGTPDKPVGLVHIAVASTDNRTMHKEKRYGDIGRSAVRMRTVADALELMHTIICTIPGQPRK